MDTQPPVSPTPDTPAMPTIGGPGPSPLVGGPGGSPMGVPGGGNNTIMFALIGILGLGAVIFAIMTAVFYNKATTATTTLNAQKANAAEKAKIQQKKDDDQANTIANESPFRSYFAPVEFGSFEIKFPKNWSGYVDHEPTGTQVSLLLNPDFVRRSNGSDELAAGRIMLVTRPFDQYTTTFQNQIKRGTIKQTAITVSGLKGYDLSGSFQDKKTTREVIVPVRDKVLVFINENFKYATEFNEILAQSTIVP
jgi:hypothetical protein